VPCSRFRAAEACEVVAYRPITIREGHRQRSRNFTLRDAVCVFNMGFSMDRAGAERYLERTIFASRWLVSAQDSSFRA
jgi:hypothetical protein